jgi:glutathione S-transferase
MKLYHCKQSRSSRVLWFLEELGLDYEIETMPFDPNSLKSADYLALNPFGKVPVFVDGSLIMFESVAIIQYLLEHHANGRLEPPRSSMDYGLFLQWMHFGESTLMGPVSELANHRALLPEGERDPVRVKQALRGVAHYVEGLNRTLAQHDYLIGNEFSAADIVVGYTLHVAKMYGGLADDSGPILEYYERLAARPAFVKAMA